MKTQIPWGLKMLTACSLRKESIYFMEGSKKKKNLHLTNPYFLRNPGQRAGHLQPVVGSGMCTGKGEALQFTAAVCQAAPVTPKAGPPAASR